MSNKQFPEFNAKPFDKVIDESVPTLTHYFNVNEPQSENAQISNIGPLGGCDKLVKDLRAMVNPDVCLSEPQQRRLIEDMYLYLQNPDQTKLLTMVTVINSYRVECSRCLNGHCNMRDLHDV